MSRVKVADFIKSSAAYSAATVDRANTNGNPYLTKAEAQKLPIDLQDNFANHRALARDNGTVMAAEFKTAYAGYVAVNADRADKNNDGIISKNESKSLPADLQDNFWNFRASLDGKPSLSKLRTAQESIETDIFKTGANGIGVGDGKLDVYLAFDDATVKQAVSALMLAKAPGIPYDFEVIGPIGF